MVEAAAAHGGRAFSLDGRRAVFEVTSGSVQNPLRLRALARVKPSAAEIAANPRARSAVMRVAERTEVAA